MTQSAKDLLIIGLRNAHALEGQAIEITERQAERLEHYPEMRARIQQHVEESRQQQAMVEQCLSRLGTSPSSLKEMALSLMGNMQAMAHAMAGDEVLKNTFASYAFEHFEIASYRSLIAMAETAGEPEIARTCEQILRQEERMAAWIGDRLEEITRQFLARSETGVAAKR
jgi:ferritin-like metal-binding protein YciE